MNHSSIRILDLLKSKSEYSPDYSQKGTIGDITERRLSNAYYSG